MTNNTDRTVRAPRNAAPAATAPVAVDLEAALAVLPLRAVLAMAARAQ